MLSAVAITGLVAFALHIANPFVDPWPRFSYELDDPTWYGPHIGVASAVVTAGIVVVPMLLLVARWRSLPGGWLTLLFGASLAGLTFLHDEGQLVGAPILGGFLADLLYLWLRPGTSGWRLQAFAFLAPVALLAAYFAVLWATGPVAWSAHLIGGTIVLAGGVGWALTLLLAAGAGNRTVATGQ
jgi:hypothetical protein